MRLNKYISSCGVCSRREADRLTEAGEITINDCIAVLGDKVTDTDVVKVKGKEVSIGEYKNNEDFKKKFSQIICVSYDGTNLEYDRLDKLIDKITKED